jgi:hypothetical protein
MTPLMQLKKFPNKPISTREEHRGSHHNPRTAPFFHPHLEMRVPFPTSLGKESRRTCRTSRGGALNLLVERNSGVVPPFQKTPMSQSSPDTPDSPALTRLSRRISTQNMMAIVTALWHLKRKPQIPMATRQHFLCCLFWDPHTPQQRTEREIGRSPSLT